MNQIRISPLLLFLFAGGLLVLDSCAPARNMIRPIPYVSTVKAKGEVDVFGTMGGTHLEGGATYSPYHRLLVSGQLYLGANGSDAQISVGSYFNLKSTTLTSSLGFSEGLINSRPTFSNYRFSDIQARYQRLFFQQSLMAVSSPKGHIGLVVRVNGVRYFRYSGSNNPLLLDSETPFQGRLDFNVIPKSFIHTDVGVSLRRNYGSGYWSLLVGGTADNFSGDGSISYPKVLLSLSVGVDINRKVSAPPSK